MKNKHVGLLIIGISIIFFFVVMSFNEALEKITNASCTMGEECPMHVTLDTQAYISYSLIAVLVLVGVFVAFMQDFEKENG